MHLAGKKRYAEPRGPVVPAERVRTAGLRTALRERFSGPGPAHDEGSLAGEGPSAVEAIQPDAAVAVAEDRSGIVVRVQGHGPGDQPGARTEGGVFPEQFAAVVAAQP